MQGSSVDSTLRGAYTASPTMYMLYGRGCVASLPTVIANLGASKAFIITGKSLREKTPVISRIEEILGEMHHAGTYSGVREHAPIADIEAAVAAVKSSGADVLLSVGGGSPIDAAKAVAYRLHKARGNQGQGREEAKWIPSIAVPTTLSVAETTKNAGFTNADGSKVAVADRELVPKAVLYDGDIALHTPLRLWLSSAIRALDHALELLYNPSAPEVPTKRLALSALTDLFTLLPQCLTTPQDADIRQRLFLGSYAALFPFQFSGALGISHAIGHAIGSTYGIPHGITSCISLGKVIRFMAEKAMEGAGGEGRGIGEVGEAAQIARAVAYIPGLRGTGDVARDALLVAEAVEGLVLKLGLVTGLVDYNVGPGEEEAIAVRALRDPAHPDLKSVTELVRTMYSSQSPPSDATTRL
ncbi:alcohol dehydrogenase [Histoplasma capsulatum H143]|uniref:Alcohol dehydrogenase n=1 Tax=Ajellomyces capsulatus (strain H143) TaxID=544712 RepID=C6HE58_AJECH|nr:alcohol dehydrogenase [Histoplasma capsulatum H143]